MLEAALSYPTSGDSGLARIAIGGVIILLASIVQFVGWITLFLGVGLIFLLVGYLLMFPALGYVVEVLASVSRDDEEPPEFEDWRELTVVGFKAFVAAFAYLIPAFVVIGVFWAVFGAGVGAISQSPDLAAVGAGVGIIGGLLSFVVYLVVLYVLPAAITNVGREGRFGAAFDFETIWTVITNDSYIVATVLAIAVSIVAGILAVVAWLTIILGVILLVLGPFVQFWLYLVFAHMYGNAFGDAVDDTPEGSDESASVA